MCGMSELPLREKDAIMLASFLGAILFFRALNARFKNMFMLFRDTSKVTASLRLISFSFECENEFISGLAINSSFSYT